jgi:signal peptidase II
VRACSGDDVKRYAIAGALAALVTLLDQVTKLWAVRTLTDGARHAVRPVTVVVDCFHFRYSENTGMAFGGLQGYGGVLTVVGVAALGFVLWLLVKHPRARYRSVAALGLIAGGAVGNLADRFRLGYVVDFIVWHIRDAFVWPAFNIADAALVVGVAMIVIWPEKEPAQKPAAADGT